MTLNPDQFFHGTTHNITDGMVRPADHADKSPSEYSFGDPGDMSEGDHAFVARNDENYAWHAAMTFHRNGRRPRVYETGPADDMKPGPWNKEHPDWLKHVELDHPDYPPSQQEIDDAGHQDEWASKTGFPVRRRIDIMPGRQGTFPQINWNRFKVDGPRAGLDANHPDPQTEHESVYGKPPAPPKPQARNLREFMDAKPGTLEPPVNQRGQGRLF